MTSRFALILAAVFAGNVAWATQPPSEGGAAPAMPGRKSMRTLLSETEPQRGPLRAEALRQLASQYPQTEEDVDLLVEAYKRNDAAVQQAVEKNIQGLPVGAAHLKRRFVGVLDDKSESAHRLAFMACARLGAKEAIPTIRTLLSNKPRHKFSKKGFGGAAPETIQYAQLAARALVELDDVNSIDEILSRDEIMAIKGFGGPLVAKFGARALPKVVALAREKNTFRSDGGRVAISEIKDESAIPALIELTKDADGQIAAAATSALARTPISSEETKGKLEETFSVLRKHSNEYLRADAYAGLLRLDAKKYVKDAMDAVQKTPGTFRLHVFYSLMSNNVQEAVPMLKEFIIADEKANPRWTNSRAIAAQTIYKLTGEKVPYKGLEIEQKLHPDPYDPTKTK